MKIRPPISDGVFGLRPEVHVSRKQRLVFIHNAKAGGTSILALLRARVPDLSAALSPEWRWWDVAKGLRLHDCMDGYTKITSIRNPWDRTVSWYAWRMRDLRLAMGPGSRWECPCGADYISNRPAPAEGLDAVCLDCGKRAAKICAWSPGALRALATKNRPVCGFEEVEPGVWQAPIWNMLLRHRNPSFQQVLQMLREAPSESDARGYYGGPFSYYRGQHEMLSEDGELFVDHIIRFESLREDVCRVFGELGLGEAQLPHINKSSHKHYSLYYDETARDYVAAVHAEDLRVFGYRFDGSVQTAVGE